MYDIDDYLVDKPKSKHSNAEFIKSTIAMVCIIIILVLIGKALIDHAEKVDQYILSQNNPYYTETTNNLKNSTQ